MKFNDVSFLFLFLPLTVVGFYLVGRLGRQVASQAFLVVASISFYGAGRSADLAVFLIVIGFNYLVAHPIGDRTLAAGRRSVWLAAGLVFNLGILGYFKYAGFFAANLSGVLPAGWAADAATIALPIGISFYIFQQIAYLVDRFRDPTMAHSSASFGLFVSFFPHLIAGPIVKYAEVARQFEVPEFRAVNYANMSVGIFLITLGLAKKLVLADGFAMWVEPVFDRPATPGFIDAWVSALAYTLQIYFDFSGYSDLAVGLALLFNVRFPFNFESPYRSLSVTEFWQRWHITLGRFLREYVYFPLGGSRLGLARTCINLMAVFALGGLWHGANWTFVLWGVLQGAALVVHRLWREGSGRVLPPHFAWAVTFLFTVLAWVPFRAPSIGDTVRIWSAMFGIGADGNGFALSIGGIHPLVAATLFGAIFALVFFAPNSRTLSERFEPGIRALAATAAMWCAIFVVLGRNAPFIYFQF